MRNRMIFLVLFIMAVMVMPANGETCTSFFLDGGDIRVVGKNYDWVIGNGLVIVNKRGMEKRAYLDRSTGLENPVRWVSKYGSITFNQYGRELPMGGINEAGLVVEVLLLPETVYPGPDPRPAVSVLQWVQYQLDNFSTIDEVVASDAHVRIPSSHLAPGMHYFVCDRRGRCAVIEFLVGEMVSYTGVKMPFKVITNNTYEDSVRYGNREGTPMTRQNGSLPRFITAKEMLEKYDRSTSTSAVADAFDILERVSQGSFTQWRIVYDIQNMTIYFLTNANRETRHIDFKSFDFSCASAIKVLDINHNASGDVSKKFTEYTQAVNRAMIKASFTNTSFLVTTPDDLLEELTRYPDTNTCVSRN